MDDANSLPICTEMPVPAEYLEQSPQRPELLSLATVLYWNRWDEGLRELYVHFLDGDPVLQARVKPYAHEWSRYAGLRFVFCDELPTPPAATHIRISFMQPGSWSFVGTQALLVPQDRPTMNLGWLTPQSEEREYARVVTHEFGHALGLIHEHQNPAGAIPWDKEAVYAYYMRTQQWDRPQVDAQIFGRYSRDQLRATAFDPRSIMIYAIPLALTGTKFQVDWNYTLSDQDKAFIAEIYPKQA